VTLERFVSEELPKPRIGGIALADAIHLRPTAPGGTMFLLAPGGQDYVGDNSYDEPCRSQSPFGED